MKFKIKSKKATPTKAKKKTVGKQKPKQSRKASGVEPAPMTGKVKSLVLKVDQAIADAEDAEARRVKYLLELREAIGESATVDHHKLGPMTIMSRGDKVFWRAKPVGKS